MSKFLVAGYALTIAVLCGLIALGRGTMPTLDGIETLYLVVATAILLLPAGVMLLTGATASVSWLRKVLGYLIGTGCAGLGLTAAVVLVIFLVGRLA